MKGGVGFSENKDAFIPPPVNHCDKNGHNFFSIGPISMKKILGRKKHPLCLFSRKIFDFVCFPRKFDQFYQKTTFFRSNYQILVGNRQSCFFSKKCKSLSPGDAFPYPKFSNTSKSENVKHTESWTA